MQVNSSTGEVLVIHSLAELNICPILEAPKAKDTPESEDEQLGLGRSKLSGEMELDRLTRRVDVGAMDC